MVPQIQVQCVAACMLRNAIALSQHPEKPLKPTLIISPNDAVGTQWYETLVKANVAPSKIYRFKAKSYVKPSGKHHFYLCNRYDLQTETRFCFERLEKEGRKSPLFPNAPKKLLKLMDNQYKAEQGKAKNWLKAHQHENNRNRDDRQEYTNTSEWITRSLSKYVGEIDTVFETVVIDEAVSFKIDLTRIWFRILCSRVSSLVVLEFF